MPANPQELAEAENDSVLQDRAHVLLPASQGSSRTGKEIQHRITLTPKSKTPPLVDGDACGN